MGLQQEGAVRLLFVSPYVSAVAVQVVNPGVKVPGQPALQPYAPVDKAGHGKLRCIDSKSRWNHLGRRREECVRTDALQSLAGHGEIRAVEIHAYAAGELGFMGAFQQSCSGNARRIEIALQEAVPVPACA